MNPFFKAIDDIFKVPEFLTSFTTIEGEEKPCISVRPLTIEEKVTLFGVDAGESYELTCKAEVFTPKKGNRITYNGTLYKIEDPIYRDSFGLTYNFTIRSLSSK